jgi:hypothetical protein
MQLHAGPMARLRRLDGASRCWAWPWRASRAGWLLMLLLGGSLAGPCRAQSGAEALEYRVKAAFVCKFASYVEWPAQLFARPDSPIVIGVVGTDAVADELARTAAGLSAEGRPLVVRRLERGDAVASAHVVYIAGSHEARLAETLAAAKGQPVLLVTESSRAPAMGSMINFVVVDDKVRFDIAPQAAEQSHLRISARLLSVARAVIGKGP